MDFEGWCRVCRRRNDDSGHWTRALDVCHRIPAEVLKLDRRATLSVGVFEVARAPDYNWLQSAVAVKRIPTDVQSVQVQQWSHDLDIKGRQKVVTQIQRDQFVLESEQTVRKCRKHVSSHVQEFKVLQFGEQAYFKNLQLVVVEVKSFEPPKGIEYVSGK